MRYIELRLVIGISTLVYLILRYLSMIEFSYTANEISLFKQKLYIRKAQSKFCEN